MRLTFLVLGLSLVLGSCGDVTPAGGGGTGATGGKIPPGTGGTGGTGNTGGTVAESVQFFCEGVVECECFDPAGCGSLSVSNCVGELNLCIADAPQGAAQSFDATYDGCDSIVDCEMWGQCIFNNDMTGCINDAGGGV